MPRKSSMLSDLKVEIRQRLVRQGFAPREAVKASVIAVDTLREIYGGDQPYIPKNDVDASPKEWEIWNLFNGLNHLELAKRFSLSERMIYKIVEKMKALTKKKNQPFLFAEMAEEDADYMTE